MSQASAHFKKFADAIGGGLSHDGRTISYKEKLTIYYQSNKDACLAINSELPLVLPKVHLIKETGYHRFGKRLGLNREVQIGYEEFDRYVYIQNFASDEATQQLLSHRNLQDAVIFLFNSGFDLIEFSEDGVKIIRNGIQFEDISPEKFREIMAAANVLLASIPVFENSEDLKERNTRARPVYITLSVAAALIAILMAETSESWPTLDPNVVEPVAFKLACAVWILALPILARILRGYHDSLRALGWASLICFFIHVGGLMIAVKSGNALLDNSVAVKHSTTILRKRLSGGKVTTRYITVPSWRPGEKELEIEVDRSLYASRFPGSPIVITTKSGAFGWEWIVSYQ